MLQFSIPIFVPGNRPERFEKAAQSGADAVILDLEDAVAPSMKDQARSAITTSFTELPILVRINAEGSPWFNDDVLMVSQLPLAGVILPKAALGAGLERLVASNALPIFALIENATGLAQAREIAAHPTVERLIFGTVDYCADLGCAHTREALLSARNELVLASRLTGCASPIDGVTTSIDDGELILQDARHSRDLGFGGKLCIHPKQVSWIKTGLMPDESEVNWARKVLASGEGAVAVDGWMIDEPVRMRARAILSRQWTD